MIRELLEIAAGSEAALRVEPGRCSMCAPPPPCSGVTIRHENIIEGARFGISMELVAVPLSGRRRRYVDQVGGAACGGKF